MGLEPLVPLVVPFIIGLLVGVIIKRGIKLIVPIIALIIVLVATGAMRLGFSGAIENAAGFLPQLTDKAGDLVNYLPYTSVGFLIGLALGFFKG